MFTELIINHDLRVDQLIVYMSCGIRRPMSRTAEHAEYKVLRFNLSYKIALKKGEQKSILTTSISQATVI